MSTFSTIKAGMTYNAAVASLECSSSSTSLFTCTSTQFLYVVIPYFPSSRCNASCMCLKCSIRFAPSSSQSSSFGGITIGTVYYVQSIPSSTTFSISATRGGSLRALTAGTNGDFGYRCIALHSIELISSDRHGKYERPSPRSRHHELHNVSAPNGG